MVENLGIKVVFDNSHGEIVGVLSFAKEDYSALASIFQLFGCRLDVVMDRISNQHLAGSQVLIIPVPTKQFQQDEVLSIKQFVEGGGGLLLIGEYGGYANNDTYLNQLGQMFGIQFNRDVICDSQARLTNAAADPKKAMVCPIVDGIAQHPAMEEVTKLRLELSCSVTAGGTAVPLAWAGNYSFADRDFNYQADTYEQRGNVIFLAATQAGAGRVVCMGDSSLLSNENLLDPNHSKLGLNLIRWLAGIAQGAAPGFGAAPAAVPGMGGPALGMPPAAPGMPNAPPAAPPTVAAPAGPPGFGPPAVAPPGPAPLAPPPAAAPPGPPSAAPPGFGPPSGPPPAAPPGFGPPSGPSPAGPPGFAPPAGAPPAPLPDLSPPGAPPGSPGAPGPFGPPPSIGGPVPTGAPDASPPKDKPRIPPPPPPPPRKN